MTRPLLPLLLLTALLPNLTPASGQFRHEASIWSSSIGTCVYRHTLWGKHESTTCTNNTLYFDNWLVTAPDGILWLLGRNNDRIALFDQKGYLQLDQACNFSPSHGAFDKAGQAWITHQAPFGLSVYTSKGVLVKTYPLPHPPRGIAFAPSQPGRFSVAWIAAFTGLPARVMRFDLATTQAVSMGLPAGLNLHPTSIACDNPGTTGLHSIWIGGTGAGHIVKMRSDGLILGTFNLGPDFDNVVHMNVDRDNNIWVASEKGWVVKLDNATGQVLLHFAISQPLTTCRGLTLDVYGRPWTLSSEKTTQTLRRHDPATGAVEFAQDRVGSLGAIGTGRFTYAMVTSADGDEDGDGEGNRTEVLNGSSPYDPLSNSTLRTLTRGPSRIGTVPYLEVTGTAPGTMLLYISAARRNALALPGVRGHWFLDPNQLLVGFRFPVPLRVNLPIPPLQALVGYNMYIQGVCLTGPVMTFTSLTGITVSY